MTATVRINAFKGLNNVSDPARLGLGWMHTADNVDVTDTGALVQRPGYSLLDAVAAQQIFSTTKHDRAYVVRGFELAAFDPDLTTRALKSLAGSGRMHWAQINESVFFNNGVDRGIIEASGSVKEWAWPAPSAPSVSFAGGGSLAPGVYQARITFTLPDGRETGSSASGAAVVPAGGQLRINGIEQQPGLTTNLYIAPANSTVFQFAGVVGPSFTWDAHADALGYDLATADLSPLPLGATVIQAWRGQLFAAQYLPSANQSVVWVSEPLGFHLFDLAAGFFMVPGEVRMLVPLQQALVVGTEGALFAYDGDMLSALAAYGVPPGRCWDWDTDTTALIWTNRGVCRALPFEPLTQGHVSLAPGAQAGSTVVRRNGEIKFITTAVSGGSPAFNPRI